MSRLRAATVAVIASAALSSLIVANADAAAWQGPGPISAATVNADGATIALGRAGDAVAVWLDDAVPGGRMAMARKRAGAAWSAPVTVVTPFSGNIFFPAVDGSGNITVAYPTGNVTTVVTWSTASASPTLTPLSGDLTVTDLKVDAAGDAVITGLSGSPAAPTLGYRRGPGGSFELHGYIYTDLGFASSFPRAAINASGTAAAVFVTGTKLLAATRTATTDWPATPETVEGALPVSNNAPAVGIDSAGNVLAAFTYGTPPTRILRTARRPVAGGWLPSSDLSANVNASADYLNLAVSPSGPAALVWSQSTAAVASVKALYGTSATGVWGQTEDVSASATTTPVAAIADDGSVVATWEHFTAGGSLEEASVRSAGAAGVWSAIRPLSAVHANGVIPSLSGDGLGDFATLGTPYDGTYHPVLLSFYDAAPPVLAPVTFTGASFAGLPVTMSTTTSDAWSAVAAPVWTFGDGFTATGLKVTHSYDFGSYLGNVSVTDAAGNSARSELIATAVSAEAFVLRAAFHPTWKRSRVSGTLTISGTVPVAGTYAITIAKHGRPESKVLASLALAPGPFARSIKLPATFLPGTTPLPGLYDVLLRARSAFVAVAGLVVKLAAPPEGVVDVAALSRTRSGKAARTLTGANAVWARFHFAAIPKGKKLTVTWYRTVKGKRVKLRTATKRPLATVRDSLGARGTHGTIAAVLTRAGKVIFETTVRLR